MNRNDIYACSYQFTRSTSRRNRWFVVAAPPADSLRARELKPRRLLRLGKPREGCLADAAQRRRRTPRERATLASSCTIPRRLTTTVTDLIPLRNPLTEDEMRAKLKLVVGAAHAIWND